MYRMMSGEREQLIKRLGVYYRQHMSGQNRRKEMLAILVLLDRSGMKISKAAQESPLSDIEKSAKDGIIKSLEVLGGRSDSHIPEDKVVYRKTEEGKTIAINPETGQVSGCGPEIDKSSEQTKESNSERPKESQNKPSSGNGEVTSTISAEGMNVFRVKGFVNKQKRNNHWFGDGRKQVTRRESYASDGITTPEQYERRAIELIQMPCGGSILGYRNEKGEIIRYDKETNDFVKGNPQKGVFTMFKPDDGMQYFESMKKYEGKKEKQNE